jgi:hypothetical protein
MPDTDSLDEFSRQFIDDKLSHISDDERTAVYEFEGLPTSRDEESDKTWCALFAAFEDLRTKDSFVFRKHQFAPVFVRYLFHGMWVLDILQIPYGTAATSAAKQAIPVQMAPPVSASQRFASIIALFESSFVADNINGQSWLELLKDTARQLGESSSCSADYSWPPTRDDKSKLLLHLTIAVALQAFCRSELFLHLSEHHWSADVFHKVHWLDYARVGRGMVQQHMAAMAESDGDADERDARSSQVWLLDALYVRLMTTSSQREVSAVLQASFTSDAETEEPQITWLTELEEGLKALPIDWAVCEVRPSGNPNQFAWRSVYHHCSAVVDDGAALNQAMPWKDHFHGPVAHQLSHRLLTSPSVTALMYSHAHGVVADNAPISVSVATPIFRCPLLMSDWKQEDALASAFPSSYEWDVHRVVVASVSTSALPSSAVRVSAIGTASAGSLWHSNADVAKFVAATELSFLLAQILG